MTGNAFVARSPSVARRCRRKRAQCGTRDHGHLEHTWRQSPLGECALSGIQGAGPSLDSPAECFDQRRDELC